MKLVNSTDVDSDTKRSPLLTARLSRLEKETRQAIWLAVGLGAVGLGVFLWSLTKFGSSPSALEKLGGFLSGTVGPIWAAAGLLLIYVAFLGQQRQILLQEDDLALNRAELKATRHELKNQSDQLSLQHAEMEHQNATLNRQSFESSFYQLLRFFRDSCEKLTASPGKHRVQVGQAAFQEAVNQLSNRLAASHSPSLDERSEEALIANTMAVVCLEPESDFGHYFRTLYHLIRLVERSEAPDSDVYIRLIRAQMSNNEVVLLYVDGLSNRPRMKELIERHALLKGIRIPEHLRQFQGRYAPAAYGNRAPGAAV